MANKNASPGWHWDISWTLLTLICYLSTLAAAFVSSITFVPRATSNHGNDLFVILLISCVGLKTHFSYASRKDACNSNFTLKRAALCCTAKVSDKALHSTWFLIRIHWNQGIEIKIIATAVTNFALISSSYNNYNSFTLCKYENELSVLQNTQNTQNNG